MWNASDALVVVQLSSSGIPACTMMSVTSPELHLSFHGMRRVMLALVDRRNFIS